MAFPGYGTAIAYILSWVDKLVPSKKDALVCRLEELNAQYNLALIEKRESDAAVLRKQMEILRKRIEFGGGEL